MIYQIKLVIRDEEWDITNFAYRCHISHYDDPDLDKMIELHIKVCEEIGNREDLPIEGDIIALTLNSTNHDQLLYDWLFEGAMFDGEIQFIYNEVETADIFRFWDCYCLGLEESMSVGGAPMSMTIFLSPGIIKRNNLEVREKVWKVSDIEQKQPTNGTNVENEEKQEPEIISVHWKDAKGVYNIDQIPENAIVTLYAKVKNARCGDKVTFTISFDDGKTLVKIENCEVDASGIVEVKEFDLKNVKVIK